MEKTMKRSNTLIAASLLILGAAGVAAAQTVIVQPEQEVVIREYVVEHPTPGVVVPDGYDVVIGEELPDTITVTPLGAPGFEKQYEYVVIDGQTVLVEPGTRRVVHVMK